MRGSVRRTVNTVSGVAKSVIVRRHRPDYQILLYMGLLMLLGLIVMYAIGPQRANVLNNSYGTDFYSSTYFVIKQGVSLLLALVVFAIMAIVPFSFIRRYAKIILLIGFASCVILFLTGNLLGIEAIAKCELGACRWFNLGPLGTIQPAEILKFGLLVFIAGFLGMRIKQGLVNDMDKTIIPLVALVIVSVIFVIGFQKDMGTGIAMLAIIASMMIIGGVNKRVGALLCIGAVIMGLLLIVIAPHRIERVTTFLAGDNTLSAGDADANYHINHAKIAIGSGGFVGVGIGKSVQATGYLPEAINDSVFAIMGETFGFIGLSVILLLFTALLMRLLIITDHLPDMWMKLVVAGVFGWLASHVILNVAAMIGVFPLTGITLPLLSFGGTSMIFIAAALGLAFQLSRYTTHGTAVKEVQNEVSSSRRGIGRTRHASTRRY